LVPINVKVLFTGHRRACSRGRICRNAWF